MRKHDAVPLYQTLSSVHFSACVYNFSDIKCLFNVLSEIFMLSIEFVIVFQSMIRDNRMFIGIPINVIAMFSNPYIIFNFLPV